MSTATDTTRYRTIKAEHKFMFSLPNADHDFIQAFVERFYSTCTEFKRMPTLHFSDEYLGLLALTGVIARRRNSQWEARRDLDCELRFFQYDHWPVKVFKVFDTVMYDTVARVEEYYEYTEPMTKMFFTKFETRREHFEIDGITVAFEYFDSFTFGQFLMKCLNEAPYRSLFSLNEGFDEGRWASYRRRPDFKVENEDTSRIRRITLRRKVSEDRLEHEWKYIL